MTTIETIRSWMAQAKKAGATHMAVVCDTFDYEDFPIFIKKVPFTEEVMEAGGPSDKNSYELVKRVHNVEEYITKRVQGQNMQNVMEVYRLADDWEEQLKSHRTFRYD